MLSHTYWRTKFGADPNIVGQVFEMNDRPHRVIGVLPNVPHYPQENDVYMPVLACPFRAAAEQQIPRNRRAFARAERLRAAQARQASLEQAAGAVATVANRFTQDNPQAYRLATSGFQGTTIPVREALTSGAREMLLILLGITGLILLIACANVANLTLARMLGRDRELAMRAALGAGRGRLIRQLLTESTLLAVAGGVVGVGVRAGDRRHADALRRPLHHSHRGGLDRCRRPRLHDAGVDSSPASLFGTIPALGARIDLINALKQGSNQAGDGSSRKRVQGALIVAQVAVSVVLLVGAGLLLASFYRLQRVNAGYRTDGVLSAQVFGNFSRYPGDGRRSAGCICRSSSGSKASRAWFRPPSPTPFRSPAVDQATRASTSKDA